MIFSSWLLPGGLRTESLLDRTQARRALIASTGDPPYVQLRIRGLGGRWHRPFKRGKVRAYFPRDTISMMRANFTRGAR